MKKTTTDFTETASKIWGSVVRADAPKIKELQIAPDFQKKLLNIFRAGRYYYMIFNIAEVELEFISPEIKDVLGYEPNEMNSMFFLDRIHPDDKIYFLNFENRVTQFYSELPFEKRGSYMYHHDFRVKNKAGEYIRVLHQIIPIEFDEQNFYRTLGMHTDITHIKRDGVPSFSIIGLNDEPSYYNIQDAHAFTQSYSLFTRRERQVLKLIVEGRSSKEIADELFISYHTVNAHRKNILSKAQVKTPFELLRKGINEGWI
ncbi:MAG: LuxR C-terminal-related transcriptional regulator [Flavobacteriaceae bacterium]